MKNNSFRLKTGPPWLFIICLLALVTFQAGSIHAFIFDMEQTSMSISAGIWETTTTVEGTDLKAENSAEGFIENGKYGVRGKICITNVGSHPTNNLTITNIIQIKTRDEDFKKYISDPLDISNKSVLTPGESYCYPYKISIEPPQDQDIAYLKLSTIRIDNYDGWLPGHENCPGPTPCPFGPDIKTAFELPVPVYTPTLTGTPVPVGTMTPTEPVATKELLSAESPIDNPIIIIPTEITPEETLAPTEPPTEVTLPPTEPSTEEPSPPTEPSTEEPLPPAEPPSDE